MRGLEDNTMCTELETREHVMYECESVVDVFNTFKGILENTLGKVVSAEEVIHLSFNYRCKRRLVVAVWFAVKVLYLMYQKNNRNKMQLLREIIKEIEWNLELNRKIGSFNDMRLLKDKIGIGLN